MLSLGFFKILFIIYSLVSSLYALDKIKIFTLHSYSQEYPWTKSQYNGFIDTLHSNDYKFEFYSEYLDTKRVDLTQEYQNEFVNYLNKKYIDADVDLVYVTDDNALLFIYNNYEKLFKNSKKIPVFFSGINNLNMKKILAKDTYTGVYERKEIKQNIELIKQFSPQTRNIYFVGDDSKTYNSIKKDIEQEEHNYKNMNFHYISDKYISNIQTNLPNKPRSFILLTTIGNLQDDTNNTLLVKESIEKIKQNPNLIILTMEDSYMYEGVVGGYVTNGSAQGKESAKLVLNYLQTHTLKGINSLVKNPNLYMFNSKELVNSRIILSQYISRDAIIIGKNKDFIDENHSTILNILTIITIILIFIIITMYTIFKKNSNQVSQALIEKKIHTIKSKLNSKDQFINNIIRFGDIAYWNIDTKTNELFLSQRLLEILSIDTLIYENDSEALSYFIHENDKKLFHKSILEIKKNKKSVEFKHKMVSSDKKLFNVNHIIYTEYIGDEASSQILGIIKFEK